MFDHYVAVDWAMSNMAIARMTKKSEKIDVKDVPANIKDFQIYLKSLKGSICLAFEETTTSQWLYTELKECVEKVIVCDPYRNALLKEGPKNDKIDSRKLVQLLRAGFLKEVYHSCDSFIELRKLVGAYEDLIKMGVRMKNQRSAIFRAHNLDHHKETKLVQSAETFILDGLDKAIEEYEQQRERYKKEFARLETKYPEIKRVGQIPGIGAVGAIKIVARIVDAKRFKDRNHFFSYCGLVKHERMSGGRSYGRKTPRFSRQMKSVFKTATLAVLVGSNAFSEYYEYLINEKRYSPHNARHAVARKIAVTVYGVMKSGNNYEPPKKSNYVKIQKTDL